MMAHNFTRTAFTWLAYLLLAFYGYFLNILGPITPFLKDELGLSYTVSSLHFTAFAAGILLVGLGGHPLIRRMGQWQALWIGAFGMSLGVMFLLAGRTPFMTIGAAFVMGLVGSLILAAVPSTLSEQHGELRAVALSEANSLASLVATAAPLVVGWAVLYTGGWRLALGAAAFTPAVMLLAFRRARPAATAAVPEDPALPVRPLPASYWVLWVALVHVISVEFCMIFWSADYLESGLGMPKVAAAQAVSAFLAGMILGRLAGSRLVQRFPSRQLVAASILLAGAGFLTYWQAGSVPVGVVGLFLTGLGVSNLYPLLLSLAIGAAGSNTIQASARATLASGAAILALPLILGGLADAVGIRPAYGLVGLLLVGTFLMIQLTNRLPQSPQPIVE
jgi:fucose permease